MTGSELAAAGQVVFGAAKQMLDDSGEKAALQKLAEDTPEMEAAARAYAKRVHLKQSALLKLYAPLGRLLGAGKEYFATDFHEDMANKLADIPDDCLATPPASLAVPAMEGLGYSFEEPDLKEMYLNLLATATDARSQDQAHPSFAEVIKQLSADEARLLLDILEVRSLAIARLMRKADEGKGESYLQNHLIELRNRESGEIVENSSLAIWVDNWCRLGLVEVDYTRHMVDDERYAWIEKGPQYQRAVDEDDRGSDGIKIGRGVLLPTAFGRRFRKAVSYDEVPIDVVPIEPDPVAADAEQREAHEGDRSRGEDPSAGAT